MKEEKEIISEYFTKYYPQKRIIPLNEIAEEIAPLLTGGGTAGEIAGTLSSGANIAGSAIGFGALAIIALIIFFLIRGAKKDYVYVTGNVRNPETYGEMTSTLDTMINGKISPEDKEGLQNYKQDLDQFQREDQKILNLLKQLSGIKQEGFDKKTIDGIGDLSEILLKIGEKKQTADQEIKIRNIVLQIQKDNKDKPVLQKICGDILDSLKNKEEIIKRASGYQKLILKLSTKFPKLSDKALSILMFGTSKEDSLDLIKKAREFESNKKKQVEFLKDKKIPFQIEKIDDETGIKIKLAYGEKNDGKLLLEDDNKIKIEFTDSTINKKFKEEDLIIEKGEQFLLDFLDLEREYTIFYKDFLTQFDGEIAEIKNFEVSEDNIKYLKDTISAYLDPQFLEKIKEYSESSQDTKNKDIDFKKKLDQQIKELAEKVIIFYKDKIDELDKITDNNPNVLFKKIIISFKNIKKLKKSILYDKKGDIEEEHDKYFEKIKVINKNFISILKTKLKSIKESLNKNTVQQNTDNSLEQLKKESIELYNDLVDKLDPILKNFNNEIKQIKGSIDNVIDYLNNKNDIGNLQLDQELSSASQLITDSQNTEEQIQQALSQTETPAEESTEDPAEEPPAEESTEDPAEEPPAEEKPVQEDKGSLIEKLKDLKKSKEAEAHVKQFINLDVENKKFKGTSSETDSFVKFLKNGDLEIYSKSDLKDLKDFKKGFVFESDEDYKLVFKGKYRINVKDKVKITDLTPYKETIDDTQNNDQKLVDKIKNLEKNAVIALDIILNDDGSFKQSLNVTDYKIIFRQGNTYAIRSKNKESDENKFEKIINSIFEVKSYEKDFESDYPFIIYAGEYKISENKIIIQSVKKIRDGFEKQDYSNIKDIPETKNEIFKITNLSKTPLLYKNTEYKNKESFNIKKEKISVGRSEKNDIVFKDDNVSEFHAIIELNSDKNAFKVIDNQSRNGTQHNRRDIESIQSFDSGTTISFSIDFPIKIEVLESAKLEDEKDEKDQKKNDIRNYIRENEYFIFEKNKLTPAGKEKPTDKTFLQIYLNKNTENPFKGTFSIDPKDSKNILKYLESDKNLIIDTGSIEVTYDSYNGLFKNLIKIFEAQVAEKRKFSELFKEFEELNFTYKSSVSFELDRDKFEFKNETITFKNFFDGYKQSIAKQVFSEKQNFFKSQVEGKDKNGLIKLKKEYENYVESFPVDGEPYTENVTTIIQSAIENFDKIEGNYELVFEKYLNVLEKLKVLKKKNGLNINEKRLLNLINHRFIKKNSDKILQLNKELLPIISKIDGSRAELAGNYKIQKINDLSSEQIDDLDEFIFKLNSIKAIKDKDVELGKPIDAEEEDDDRPSVEDEGDSKKETGSVDFSKGEKWTKKELYDFLIKNIYNGKELSDWKDFCFYVEFKNKSITIFKDEKTEKAFYIYIKNNKTKKDFEFEIRKKDEKAEVLEFGNDYIYQESLLKKLKSLFKSIYDKEDALIYTGKINIDDSEKISFSDVKKIEQETKSSAEIGRYIITNKSPKIELYYQEKPIKPTESIQYNFDKSSLTIGINYTNPTATDLYFKDTNIKEENDLLLIKKENDSFIITNLSDLLKIKDLQTISSEINDIGFAEIKISEDYIIEIKDTEKKQKEEEEKEDDSTSFIDSITKNVSSGLEKINFIKIAAKYLASTDPEEREKIRKENPKLINQSGSVNASVLKDEIKQVNADNNIQNLEDLTNNLQTQSDTTNTNPTNIYEFSTLKPLELKIDDKNTINFSYDKEKNRIFISAPNLENSYFINYNNEEKEINDETKSVNIPFKDKKLEDLEIKIFDSSKKLLYTVNFKVEQAQEESYKNIKNFFENIFINEIKREFFYKEQEDSSEIQKLHPEIKEITSLDQLRKMIFRSNIYMIDLDKGTDIIQIKDKNFSKQTFDDLKNGIIFYQKSGKDFHLGQLKLTDLSIFNKNQTLLKTYFDFNKNNEGIKKVLSEAVGDKFPDILSAVPCKVKIEIKTSPIKNEKGDIIKIEEEFIIKVIDKGKVSSNKFLKKYENVKDPDLIKSLKQVVKADLEEKKEEKPEEIKQEQEPTKSIETKPTSDQYFISLDDIKNKKKIVTDTVSGEIGIIFNRVKNNPKNNDTFDGHLWIKEINKRNELISFNEIIALKDYFNFNLQDFIINEEINFNDYKNSFLSTLPLRVTIINNEISSIIRKGDIKDSYYSELEKSKQELLRSEIEKTSKEDAYKKFGLTDLLTAKTGQEAAMESPTGFIAKKESSKQGFLIPKNYINIEKVLKRQGYKVYYYIKNGEDYYYIDVDKNISNILKILIKTPKLFWSSANKAVTLERELVDSEIKLKDLKIILRLKEQVPQNEFPNKKLKFRFGKIEEKTSRDKNIFFKFPVNKAMQPKVGDGKEEEQKQTNQTAIPQTEEFFENLIIKNIWKK